ncbi:hypothetical protein HYQ46_012694 [Verticillium longisporum]|nr:hypothetical protein HYQ46_012694 [Verticillium longisporum]
MRRSASRGFSTEARVHPNILPYLHNTRRTSMVPRWIPSTIAVIAVGYAASSYAMGMSQRRIPSTIAVIAVGYAASSYGMGMSQRRSARLAEMERQQAESRLRASKLMDAYGDGTKPVMKTSSPQRETERARRMGGHQQR